MQWKESDCGYADLIVYAMQADTCPWWEKSFSCIYACLVIPDHSITITVLISEWLDLLGCSWHVVELWRSVTSSRHLSFLGTVSGLPGMFQNGAVCFHSRQYTCVTDSNSSANATIFSKGSHCMAVILEEKPRYRCLGRLIRSSGLVGFIFFITS